MDSPSTPQKTGRSRPRDADVLHDHPINAVAQQLQAVTISRPRPAERKREQSLPTPASQARPRTQRRTMGLGPAADSDSALDQENIPDTDGQQQQQQQQLVDPAVAGSVGPSTRKQGFTPSRLACISALRDELSCGICLDICVRPCATPCGHNFCRSCLRLSLQHKRQCPHCREVLPPPSRWQPKVNTALWNTIQLLFPQHAAEAPPPTPPGQPAAAPQAAGSSAGAARMTEQEQQDYQAQLEVSRGRRAGRGSLYHMASAVAASQGHRDAAVRQPFRPPRGNSRGDSSSTAADANARPRQQQGDDGIVLEADLLNMLRGYQGRQASSQNGSIRTRERHPQQMGRLRPLGSMQAASQQQQEQQHAQAAAGAAGVGSQEGSSRRRLAGRASAVPGRSGLSAAAAAAAAEGDVFDFSVVPSGDDSDDELLLQEAMMLSQRSSSTAAARQSAESAGDALGRSSNRRAQEVTDVDVLFGRIHSGSSPGHAAAAGVLDEPDWLLLPSAAAPASLQSHGTQRRETVQELEEHVRYRGMSRADHQRWRGRTGAYAAIGSVRHQQLADAARAADSTAAAAAAGSAEGSTTVLADGSSRVRLRQLADAARSTGGTARDAGAAAGTAGGASAAAAGSSSLDVAALLDDLDEDAGVTAAAAAAAASRRARASHTVRGSRLDAELRSILLSSDDEGLGSSNRSTRAAAQRQQSSTAAAAAAGGVHAAGAATSTASGTAAASSASTAAASQAAGSGIGSQHQQLDVLDLTLADSPEPQPLLSRLARVAGRAPTQRQQQQQHHHQPPPPQQQGTYGAASTQGQAVGTTSSSSVAAPGSSTQAGTGSRDTHRHREVQSPDGGGESGDDDFLSQRLSTRSRMTAARASSAIAGAAGARRVVPGLRHTGVPRAARSRAG